MATVDKNFKVKNGLIVEGTTATVNGEDILTTASTTSDLAEGTNLYFTAQRAADAVADEIDTAVSTAINALDTDDIEEGTNLYFTNQRALDATSAAYDPAGAAATAESNANTYTDTEINGLTTNEIEEGLTNLYFTNQRALDATAAAYDAAGAAAAAQTAAESYADGLAVNYDAAGSAATAESNANTYTDTALQDYTTTANLDTTIDGYGYLKSADLSGYATETYVNTAVSDLVNGAPELLDTLNELAAAINDDASFASTIATQIGEKQNTLTAGSNISIVSDTISVTGLDTDDVSEGTNLYFTNQRALDATSAAYDVAGAAAAAQSAAESYADGLAANYEPAGAAQTAVDSLTTTDIEEGTNLYFTDVRAVDALEAVVPNFTAVEVNSLAKQVAATATSLGSVEVTAYSFPKATYRTAKFIVKIDNGTENEVTEVLLTLDSGDNIAITEYAIVGTNGNRGSITADVSGSNVRLRVNPVNDSTINVVGTLLA